MKYSLKIIWSEEDEVFLCICPELGLIAHGNNRVEALTQAEILIQGYLEMSLYNNEGLPKPEYFDFVKKWD